MRRALTLSLVSLVFLASAPAATIAGSSASQVTIVRDDYGVPHVFARDTERLFYGMGYVAAQDRLWQAETLRRAATGTLAELFGADALAGDVQARMLFGPQERRSALFADASGALQGMMQAYADGINAFIAAGNLPIEFTAFGFAPQPWTVEDSTAVLMLLGSQFGWFGFDELANAARWAAYSSRFGADAPVVWSDTHWLDDPDAPTTVPADAAVSRRGRRAMGPAADLPAAANAAATALAAGDAAVARAWARAGIPANGWASNAVVIGPRLSQSGAPLLLGGPQMGYSTPQINHEVGLHGGGLDVTGMSIAGLPLIPIGVGNGYAWTLTSGGSDNTDAYVEVLNPGNPAQYLYEGAWHDLDCRTETFAVAASSNVDQTLCSSVHGPVVFADGSFAFTLKNATVGKELSTLEAWIALGGAKNIQSFAARLDEVAYNFNVLYADRGGNIAYWHVGHIPIRPAGFDRFFPLPGTGEAEWQGVIAFDRMPHARNPLQGWLTSWNNKPAPGWENSSGDFWLWGGAHRVNTLISQLEALDRRAATAGTLREINRIGGWTTDTPSGSAGPVFVSSHLDTMLAAVDTDADPRLPAVVAALTDWDRLQVDADGDGFYDDANGTIFNAWWFALAESALDEVADLVSTTVLGNLIDRLLRGADAGLPLLFDYLEGETVGDAVTAALLAALDDLAVEFGSTDVDDWRQPIATISWTPIGAAGVPDTIWMNRGTYNQLVHLRGAVSAENVVAPGQSGDPFSPHFADQLPLYATWQYKQMRLSRADLRTATESVEVLTVR